MVLAYNIKRPDRTKLFVIYCKKRVILYGGESLPEDELVSSGNHPSKTAYLFQ